MGFGMSIRLYRRNMFHMKVTHGSHGYGSERMLPIFLHFKEGIDMKIFNDNYASYWPELLEVVGNAHQSIEVDKEEPIRFESPSASFCAIVVCSKRKSKYEVLVLEDSTSASASEMNGDDIFRVLNIRMANYVLKLVVVITDKVKEKYDK